MARHLTRLRVEHISYDMRTVPRAKRWGCAVMLDWKDQEGQKQHWHKRLDVTGPRQVVSCPLSGSASLLNFNPVFSKFSLWGLDVDGVNARLVCCVVPVLLPIQAFTQASALSGADSLS